MTISILDVASLVVLAIFAWRGYKKGAVSMLVSLAGLIASLLIPWIIAPWLTNLLLKLSVVQNAISSWMGNAGIDRAALLMTASNIFEKVVFVLLFILIIMIVARIKKWLVGANKLPVIGTLNRFAGACVGVLAGIIIVTAVIGGLYYIAQWTGNTAFQGHILKSSFLTLFLYVMN